MLVYLDTNVYCRPMDDQARKNIRKETEAFLHIQILCRQGKIKLLGSDVLRYEISKIPNPQKREEAVKNIELCGVHIEEHGAILALAESLEKFCRLSGRDALHIVSAVLGGAECFITCDLALIRKARKINAVLRQLNQKIDLETPATLVYTFVGKKDE